MDNQFNIPLTPFYWLGFFTSLGVLVGHPALVLTLVFGVAVILTSILLPFLTAIEKRLNKIRRRKMHKARKL